MGAEALRGQPLLGGRKPAAQAVRAQTALRGRVAGLEQASRGGVAEVLADQPHQPRRIREPHRPGAGVVPFPELGQLGAPLGGHAPQDRVDEPCGPPVLQRRQRHRVVHDCVGRHAVEEEQLKGREAEHLAHVGVGGPERRLGVGAEHGVDRRPALHRTVHELVGEAAVGGAQAGKLRERGRGVVEASAARAQAAQRGVGGRPCGADAGAARRTCWGGLRAHGRSSDRPAPRRNSAAGIRLRPSC